MDRRGPDAGWYEYKHAYQTQNAAGGEFDETFHAGHYHGKGEFYFKDFRFHELKAEYAALLENGEAVIMLTLTTNSPLRPVVNLFVAGQIQ